jgi:hypothetical protein
VLAGGLGAAAEAGGAHPAPPAGPAVLPAGLPRYYVEQSRSPARTVVRATATGALTATVRCPWRGAQFAAAQLAPAAGRVFFVICQVTTSGNVASRIYRFRLTGAGLIAGYAAVPGGRFDGVALTDLAASADGAYLALTEAPRGAPPEIMVISTRTGARAVWSGRPAQAGLTRLDVSQLSLTGDGRELVIFGEPRCRGPGAADCRIAGAEALAVSPAAGGGSLRRSRVLLRQSAIDPLANSFLNNAVVSPDSSTLTATLVYTPTLATASESVSVIQVSAATGRQERVLCRIDTGDGFSNSFFSTDPSGRYLLLDAGPAQGPVNGWIDRGRLVPLRGGADATYETWSGG